MQRNWGNWKLPFSSICFTIHPSFSGWQKFRCILIQGMKGLWDFSSWDLGKVAITARAVDFCGSEKRAWGEVAVSGDPSCSWSAFWLRESCKRQQFFALFGVLIDWDSDHRTRLLTLGSKRKRRCVVLWEKNLKRYTLHIDFPSVYFPISPVFLWIQSS